MCDGLTAMTNAFRCFYPDNHNGLTSMRGQLPKAADANQGFSRYVTGRWEKGMVLALSRFAASQRACLSRGRCGPPTAVTEGCAHCTGSHVCQKADPIHAPASIVSWVPRSGPEQVQKTHEGKLDHHSHELDLGSNDKRQEQRPGRQGGIIVVPMQVAVQHRLCHFSQR
jgi:hypothetical protein